VNIIQQAIIVLPDDLCGHGRLSLMNDKKQKSDRGIGVPESGVRNVAASHSLATAARQMFAQEYHSTICLLEQVLSSHSKNCYSITTTRS
jgi:hypothetical protein